MFLRSSITLYTAKMLERLSTLYDRHNEPLDQERIDRIIFRDESSLEKFKQIQKEK